MTLKNAVTKGMKAWQKSRAGYWLCIDPKTGEYYLHTSAAYHPAGHKAFEDVVNECLDAFFEACEKDREYTRSQEYFADLAEDNGFEFYGNGIRIRHR